MKNFNLSDINNEQAAEVCQRLGKPFISIQMNGLSAVIRMVEEKSEDQSYTNTEELTIYPTGEVSYHVGYYNDEHSSGDLCELNALIVTDCLREQGFEFAY